MPRISLNPALERRAFRFLACNNSYNFICFFSMKVAIRRNANSLGVILPKSTLRALGLGEGDFLKVTDRGLRPPTPSTSSHEVLDDLMRRIAAAVASHFSPLLIRAHSLANLHRWEKSDAWVLAYDEWRQIIERASHGELFAAMLGRDERAKRLRQSPPYVGLLPHEEIAKLNQEASA